MENRTDCRKANNGRNKVQRLQRTLYLKSKQAPERKFYSLYDKLWREDILWEAWRQVKRNKGAPGVDEVAIDEIVAKGQEGEMIYRLQERLQDQTYQFSAVRQVQIPKPKGGMRTLGINTVEDRVVLAAMKIIIEPIFEAGFHDCSYGYRPKRSAVEASKAIHEELYQQVWGVVEIDFEQYFTSIPHAKLLKLISLRICDGSLLKLIKQSIKMSVEDKGKIIPTKRGVIQGSPISPLYSNIYLNLVDQLWYRRQYPEKLQATLYRFADDVLLICRKSANQALAVFKSITERMGLTLHAEKTRITKLTDGFNFIGYNFVKRKSPRTGKSAIYIFPTKASEQKIRDKLRSLTSRRAPIKPREFVEGMNKVVIGWVNYYRHTNASTSFRRLQRFIDVRFRRYLTYRNKGQGFGWQKYPSSKLYEKGMIYIASGKLKY